MKISGSTALVTGAGRGLGRHFAAALRDRGATVHAAARDPRAVDLPGVHPLALDVTDPASVAAAAAAAADVDLVVSNAGLALYNRAVDGDLAAIRAEMEVNFFGHLHVARAFAPVLAARGGGALLTVLSRLSWSAYPGAAGYAASKAAAWSLTDTLRLELAGQGTQVTALLMGSTDTDMMAGFDVPKNAPEAVVRAALDGLEAGALEVVADDDTAAARSVLSADPSVRYAGLLAAR
jgi:NAD(P)-dependent dehydrogenase (short-subunit alcohol dehydrogenase family)